jgi:hypothetical protein
MEELQRPIHEGVGKRESFPHIDSESSSKDHGEVK